MNSARRSDVFPHSAVLHMVTCQAEVIPVCAVVES